MEKKESVGWELGAGLFPGILFGARTYEAGWKTDHVLYVGFFDLCLTIYYEEE